MHITVYISTIVLKIIDIYNIFHFQKMTGVRLAS